MNYVVLAILPIRILTTAFDMHKFGRDLPVEPDAKSAGSEYYSDPNLTPGFEVPIRIDTSAVISVILGSARRTYAVLLT